MNQLIFENIKQVNEFGNYFWSARDLQKALDYAEWRKFENVIKKAQKSCFNSNQDVVDHFVHLAKKVELGSGAKREIEDYALSRYACYLIVQNADPSKEIVALGQTYFAVQTRKQEILEQNKYLKFKSEEEKRLFLRNEMRTHNKKLAESAKKAGVVSPREYSIFQNHGYKGLYGGLGSKEIQAKKELKKSQRILDHMGTTELAANLFRATQTEEKLRREKIKGKDKANKTHFAVGKKIRQTIKELGGTMPENLPPTDSIKKVENKNKPRLK